MQSLSPSLTARGVMALAACVLVAQSGGPATGPFAGVSLIWVTPAGDAGAPPCTRMLVLDLPRDWIEGDAAAVLLTGTDAEAAAARPVAATLQEQQTAVLEYPSGPAEGCLDRETHPVEEVLGALRALRHDVGAGVVVAIGFGGSGDAVLDAVAGTMVARHLGADGPRLAAGAARDGAGHWTYRAGRAPPATERWAERVPHLCAALARNGDNSTEADCMAALGGAPAGIVAGLPPRP